MMNSPEQQPKDEYEVKRKIETGVSGGIDFELLNSPKKQEQARRVLYKVEREERRIQSVKEEEALGYRPFSAERRLWELKHLSLAEPSLSHHELRARQKEMLCAIRRGLLDQQRGIARLITDLHAAIEQNYKIPSDELFAIAKECAPKYKFSQQQISSFHNAVKEFAQKRAAVYAFRERYPVNRLFFAACFGRQPQGKVEVEIDAMTILFRCHDIHDYAVTSNYHKKKDGQSSLSKEDIKKAAMSGGVALSEVKIPELKGTVIVENKAGSQTLKNALGNDWKQHLYFALQSSRQTRIHEEQHQFNKLFRPLEMHEEILTLVTRITENFSERSPEEIVQDLIRGLARYERRAIGLDRAARNEILAYYKDGRGTDKIERILTTSPLYDFKEIYTEEIEHLPKLIKDILAKNASEIFYISEPDEKKEYHAVGAKWLDVDEARIAPHVEEVFGKEYGRDLKNWLKAISVLEKKGYERENILSLLYQEPVNHWPNLARRMPSIHHYHENSGH